MRTHWSFEQPHKRKAMQNGQSCRLFTLLNEAAPLPDIDSARMGSMGM